MHVCMRVYVCACVHACVCGEGVMSSISGGAERYIWTGGGGGLVPFVKMCDSF